MRRASWWRGGEEGEQHPPARAASTAAADLGGGSGEGKAPGVGARWRGRTARAGRWGGGGAAREGGESPRALVRGLLFLLRGDAGGRGRGRKEEGRQVHAAPRALARAVIRQSASERATWAAGLRHGAKQPANSLHSAPHCPPSARAAGVALSPPRGHDETRRRQARGVSFPFHPLVHHSPVPQLICLIRF
jgi:hypothetical protein